MTRFVHAAVTVSSEAAARLVFEEVFGLPRVKESRAGRELTRELFFGLDAEAGFLLYEAGGGAIEVFVCPERAGRREGYDHLCLAVEDRAALVERARALGLEVARFPKGETEILFLRDADGNLYEIKEC